MVSIERHGIQVPLTVYREGAIYRLIDGERRWRCARKLNMKSVPVIVQDKPTELQNLLLMYNIHALREQWDYFTIASKLERVIELYRSEHGEEPNEPTLSQLTGLSRGAIRRCRMLLDLPGRFRGMILSELEKPKPKQKLTEDFFIEMEKSLKSVTKRLPVFEPQIDQIRDTLIAKYSEGVIGAVTDFRQLSKIATATETLDVGGKRVVSALNRLFDKHSSVNIRETYDNVVALQYEVRKVLRDSSSLREALQNFLSNHPDQIEDELEMELDALYHLLKRVLRR